MSRASILIVEDEAIVANEIKSHLRALGYGISGTAHTGEDAIQKASETTPDLVLMDIRLSGKMDGVEAAGKIRADSGIPVVYLTAYTDEKTLRQAKITEPFAYITKPFERKELHAAVEMAMYRHQVETEREVLIAKLRRTLDEKIVAENEKEKYRSTLEAVFRSLDSAIITLDPDLTILAANEITEAVVGCPPRKLVGNRYPETGNPLLEAGLSAVRETLRTKRPVKEYRVERKRDCHPDQTVLIRCTPLINKARQPAGAVLVIRDISQLTRLEGELEERHTFRNIIGRSKKMQEIFQLVETLSDMDTTVLITGKSGTGKELIGKALHYGSARGKGPMVTVNCSALSESLLESELFGHVRGAFTGAVRDRVGRFQIADGGTLFLDEIGEISPAIQYKLLRVLQEKEFEVVGDSTPVKVDVRIIAATNCDLKEKVRQGSFREDLYYRLKVMEIKLPPLRERREDIPLLVDHFIRLFDKKNGRHITGVSDEVITAFMRYPWPGNIRELEHAIEHAFVLCRNQIINSDHLPAEIRLHSPVVRQRTAGNHGDERLEIVRALDAADWNKTLAAGLLGISRPTLYKKISTYKITRSG